MAKPEWTGSSCQQGGRWGDLGFPEEGPSWGRRGASSDTQEAEEWGSYTPKAQHY